LKFILLLLLSIITTLAIAQFARIEDKDGYVNIREGSDLKSKIVGKFVDSDIFWCLEPSQDDWFQVDLKSPSYHGFIHKSRVKFIKYFYSIKPSRKDQNIISFGVDSIKVEIKIRPFDGSKNKIKYEVSGDRKDVSQINDKESWGNFGTMPRKEYEYISLIIGRKILNLPKESIENLFEPNFNYTYVNFDRITNTLYISASNSDGAGAYVVLWNIKDGKYISRTTAIPF